MIMEVFLCIPSFIWTFLYSQKYKISSKYIKWQIIKSFVLFFIYIIFGIFYMGYIVNEVFLFYVVFTILGILSGSLIYKIKLYLR